MQFIVKMKMLKSVWDVNLNMKNHGFSIIEVMVAVAVVAGLGGALYRLQLSSLAVSQQIVTRQLVAMYTDDLVSKMNSQVNFVSLAPKDNAMTSMYLEAGSYGVHKNAYVDSNAGGAGDCHNTLCTEEQLSAMYLQEWKKNFSAGVHLQPANVRMTIWRDYKMGVPKFDRNDYGLYDPNCDGGEFAPIVVKVSWLGNNEDSEFNKLTRDDNYIIYRVAGR